MSFILKDNPIVVNIKLTDDGRKNLASGNFNVTKFAIGDSEMNYKFYKENNIENNLSNILSPKNYIKDIRYKIKKNVNDTEFTYNTKIITSEDEVINCINMGFFEGEDLYNMVTKIDRSYVKEDKIKIDLSDINSLNPNILRIKQSDNFIFVNEPEIGDYILVNWNNPYNNSNNFENGIIDPDVYSPFIWYKILSITGSLFNNNLSVEVDKNLPNFGILISDQYYSNCILYPKNDSIKTYYGTENLSDYWNLNNDELIENCKGNVFVTQVWSFNIVYPISNIGFLENTINPNNLNNYIYNGFINFIENSTNNILGIVHYTNSTPTNQIGESFYKNSAELILPTIMWYKNSDNKIGLKLKCSTELKRILNYDLIYYDLIDDNNFIVGKCFPNIKIFLIEDQELLTSLNYKSNRNWTIPPLNVSINTILCND